MDDQALLQYSRQIMLPDIDVAGQEKLLAARVLIVGLGGLGCPVALYLAAAGIGSLVIADFDEVDLTNLQRQIAHTYTDIGLPKTVSAEAAISAINPHIQVTAINQKLEGTLLQTQVDAADLVLDCCDNFKTRFAVNRACVLSRTPLVSGAAIGMEGQVVVFDSRQVGSPCYQCLHPVGDDEQLSCSENGVVAPLTGVIGTLQAMQAIKRLVGFGNTTPGKLLLVDLKQMEFHQVQIKKQQNCPVCAEISN